ncbi:VCBS domain-containing protein, partial [Vibrio makurazakiensis]|uniref:VCBS domain-containing protein n=1 Tax=Vibrio makurazakiensis TaxID=2910250 RepID=UPI003D096A56
MKLTNLTALGYANGAVVLDAQGQMRRLEPGEQPGPGDLVVDLGEGAAGETDISAQLIGEQLQPTDVAIDDVIAQLVDQIEQGVDPTQQGEDFATAAGGQNGSSLTGSGDIERTGAESQASTEFETEGLESQGLSETQSLALIQVVAQALVSGISFINEDETNAPIVTGGLLETDVEGVDFVPVTDEAGDNGFGVFSIDADGNWTFTADDAYDELAVGDSNTDTITVITTDGTEQVITVTIDGTNDLAVITPEVGDVIEAGIDGEQTPIGSGTTGGVVSIVDPDNGESIFQPVADLTGDFGNFTFDPNTGVWGYILDEALADSLNAGDEETDVLEVTSLDGTDTETITVNILGSNDGATITPSESEDVNVVEVGLDVAGDATAGGQLLVEDVDDGEAKFQDPGDLQGEYGTFTFNTDTGVWGYTLDPDLSDPLNQDDAVTDSLQVTSLDGTATETITVNILGSNDGATITPSESEDVNVVEVGLDVAGDATAGGQLLVEDVDDGEAKFQDPGDLQGDYGTFTFNTDTGVWGYTLDPDLSDPLNQDDAVTDSLQVTSLDGTATETIT